MPTVTVLRHSPTLVVALVLTVANLTGCGGDQDDAATRAAPEIRDDGPAEATITDTYGDGFIELGGERHAFNVRICDLSGEADDDYQTIYGRGNLPNGQPFDVFVSRTQVGDILSHTVSFQSGDVTSPEGTVMEAQRMRQGGSWMDLSGGPNQPLIEIEGNRVVAEGRFAPPDPSMEAQPVDGRLEATCNR